MTASTMRGASPTDITGFYKPTSGRILLSLGGAPAAAETEQLTSSGKRWEQNVGVAAAVAEQAHELKDGVVALAGARQDRGRGH